MRYSPDPPCRLLPPVGHGQEPLVPHLHATLWLEVEAWQERLRGHLHLLATEAEARRQAPWRVVDVAGHPFEPLAGGPPLPADAGELLEAALRHLHLRCFRSTALGAVSRLGEPLAAFRSRVLTSLRPEIQYRVDTARSGGAPGELPAAVSRVGGGFEEAVVEIGPDHVRRASLGVVLIPAGLELPAPGPWDDGVGGPVRGGRRS